MKKYADIYVVGQIFLSGYTIMENKEKELKLDEGIVRDFKHCKEKAELVEKLLTMLVKGFAPEY